MLTTWNTLTRMREDYRDANTEMSELSNKDFKAAIIQRSLKEILISYHLMKIYQNMRDTAKAILREKFIALNPYVRKEGLKSII